MRTTSVVSKRTPSFIVSTKAPEAPKAMPRATEKMLIDAMTDAHLLHRDALEIELAIGLSLFGLKGEADKATLQSKKDLRNIYLKAGYDAENASGSDYKTVMRRIGATADLYAKIGGRETLIDWIGDAAPAKQVEAIVEGLKQFRFSGISDVQAYVGKGQAKRSKPAAEKKADDKPAQDAPVVSDEIAQMLADSVNARREAEAQGIPPGRVFVHGPVKVAIPFEASYDDVMSLALELIQFAKTQMPLPVEAPAEAAQ